MTRFLFHLCVLFAMLFAETANASPPRISIVALVPRCSSSQILAAPLGDFDPSLLENGFYQIRLVASDLLGREVSTEPTLVQVDGKLKVGLFRVAFEDLNIPMAGLPLSISREYDSRRSSSNGDFGPGWSLGFKSIRVVKNRNLGTDWKQYSVQNGLFKLYYTEPVKSRRVVLVLPDDSTLAFEAYAYTRNDPRLPENASTVIFATAALMKFRPLKGTKGTLEPLDQNNAPYEYLSVSQGSFDLLDPAGNLIDEAWNPSRFRYTTPDGTSFIVDEKLGLLSQNTPDGQSLSVLRDAQQRIIGLRHSSGPEIRVDRDAAGRISSLTDPAGNSVDYDYDAQGRLISVNDRVGATTSFDYLVPGFPHYLSGITDPRGLKVMSNAYSPEGRLVGQSDADGNAMSFGHDLPQRRESVTDRLGNVTVHEYDYAGNVTKTTDALGNITLREYDSDDNEIKTTDALGHITRRTFDEQKNPLSESSFVTLADGSVTEAVKRMQYNANGRLTRVTATDGTQTSFSYDAQSHLTSITNAAGDVTRCTYDASGNLSRIIDPQNNSTSFEYDEYGYRTAKENRDASNALLSRETYVHDGLGRVTETRTAILINGISQGESVMKHSYDANGRLLSTTAADGGVSSTEYDAAGLAVKSTDALGHVSTTEWDASGRVARHVSASGLVSTTNYDAEGRITTVTTSSGSLPPQAANSRVTRTEYDALGRPIATIDALGKISRSEYDALGRLTATVDATGLRTERIYDPASGSSRLLEVRAPGGTLKYGYDIAGRQVSVTDALGRVTLTEFDGAGRPVATVFPDGSRSKFEYDNLGRQIAMTDEMNHRTEFAYDGAGRLLQVTDALQGSTKFAYDSRGLKLTQIDANQHCTSFRYDANGRRVARILPAGQTETYAYNAGNQLVRHSDFNGKTTSYQYDAEGRLVEKAAAPNHPSLSLAHAASKITYAFDVFGQAVSSVVWHGGQVLHQTSYTFDANGQMSQRATDEGLIDYSYDAAGRLLSAKSDHASGHELSYVYDTAGRLSTVNAVDATGHTRRASYSYDAVGNLASQKHGAITQTFSFDTRNRLTELNATVSGLSFSYTLNLAGRRTQSLENGQIFNFDYDALHRLISEAQNGGGLAQYSLDAVGNRTGVQSTLSGVDSKTYSYDANDRVIGDTYDANGNTLSSTQGSDTYDFDNRLIRRVTGSGKVIDLFYDADGQRVAKRVNDLETRYLLDTQNPTGYAQCVEELQVVDSLRSVVHRSYFGLQLFAEEKITWTGDIPSSDLRFTHQDGHGSVRALSNSSGDLTESLTYDAFGILRNKTGNFDLHHGYTSEFYDADLGLYYLRARWYRPELGRFWTMDRHEGSGEDPLSLHKYLYANAEPVNNRDPSGQFSILEMLASSGFANSIGNMYNGSVFGVGNGMIASVMGVMAGKTMNEVAIGFVLDETGIGLVIDLAKYVSDLVMRMCNNAALAAEAEFSVLMQYYVVPWFVAIDESNDNAAGAQEYLDGLFEPIPGPQCFNAGTPIATSAGSKPVEKISKNDQVWSWDDKVQKKVLKPVLQTFTLQRDIGCDLTVDGEVLHTTPEHPFYLADRTWRAAAHLLPGDRLFDPSNSKGKRVDEVKVLASHRQVYNFEVEGLHNYFVGEKWVLVHNVGGHHHFFQNAFVKGLGLRSIQYGPKFLGPARKLSSATHEATHRMLNDYLRAKGMCPQGGKNSIKAADLCKGKSIQDIVDLHRDFYVKHGNSIPGMAPGKALELFDGEVIQIIRLNSH